MAAPEDARLRTDQVLSGRASMAFAAVLNSMSARAKDEMKLRGWLRGVEVEIIDRGSTLEVLFWESGTNPRRLSAHGVVEDGYLAPYFVKHPQL